MSTDPFEVLGIPRSASERDAKAARRRLLADLHPDRLPSDLPHEALRAIERRRNEVNDAFEQVILIINSPDKSEDSSASIHTAKKRYNNQELFQGSIVAAFLSVLAFLLGKPILVILFLCVFLYCFFAIDVNA